MKNVGLHPGHDNIFVLKPLVSAVVIIAHIW